MQGRIDDVRAEERLETGAAEEEPVDSGETLSIGSGDAHLTIVNDTGLFLESFMVKSSNRETYSSNLLDDTDGWRPGVTATLRYDGEDIVERTASGDIMLRPHFDIAVSTDQGVQYTISSVRFDVMEEARLVIQDGTLVVEYRDGAGSMVPWSSAL